MTHPCHKDQLASINRIEGQIRGISRMIDDGKYCIDILDQLKAAKNSIKSVEAKILKTHLKEKYNVNYNRQMLPKKEIMKYD